MGSDHRHRLPLQYTFSERSSRPLISPEPSDEADLLDVFFLAEHACVSHTLGFGIEGMIGVAC